MFFSPSRNGFFTPELHSDIPLDAIEITEAEHQALLNGLSQGMVISLDEAGRPVLADAPGPSEAQLAEHARARRTQLLRESDWTQLPDAPLDDAEVAAWGRYRRALRELPQQAGWPREVAWPEAPAP